MTPMNHSARKSENRRRLLDEGVRLLLHQGYHASGLQEILARAGVPKGSFYHYFPSKEAFGAAVIAHYIEPFIRQLDDWLNRPHQDPVSALRGYFEALITELQANDFQGGCLLGNLMAEIGDTSDTCRRALQQALYRYRDKIAAALHRAQEQGLIGRDRTPEALADFIVDYWQGALLRMKIERSDAPLERFMEQVFQRTLR